MTAARDQAESQLSDDLRSLVSALADTPDSLLPARSFGPGDRIGRYLLRREIGRGGFGVMFEAHDGELDRLVAVKLTRLGRGGLEAFRREAQAVARLSHPNVVVVHDFGAFEELPYIVMELLVGRTLDAMGPLPAPKALAIAVAVARGVAHAHEAGLVHRDIKPSNVFVTSDGQVKVLDFGLAQSSDGAKLGGGTPAFMAPEQWRDQATDARTDVFALGALLFFMLVGESPFALAGGRSAVLDDSPSPPLPARFFESVARLVARALDKAPERRFQTAAEFLAASEAALTELAPAGRPRRALRLALAAALLLTAGGMVAGLRHRQKKPPAIRIKSTQVIDSAVRCGADPSFLPDGRRLVYSGLVDGDLELLMVDLESHEQRRLTHADDWDYAPAVSPDGKSVAYLHIGTTTELRVLSLEGDDRQHPALIVGPTYARPTWSARGGLLGSSADGRSLYEWDLRTSPPTSTLFARLPAGAVLESLAAYTDGVVVGDWHSLSSDNNHTLGELRRGAPPRLLSQEQDPPTAIIIDHSQTGFYRAALAAPSTELRWMGRAGGDQELLPAAIAPRAGMSLSPGGDRMAFSTCAGDTSLVRLRSGKPPFPVTRSATRDCCVNRVDARRVVFTSRRSGATRVWTLDLSSGEARAVSPPDTSYGAASPDGRSLTYEGQERIWVQSLDGGEARPLTSGHHDNEPHFSFDGRSVLFLRALDDRGYPFIVDVAGGEPRPLGSQPAGEAVSSAAADRVGLLLEEDDGWRVALTDSRGRSRQVLQHVPLGAYQSLRFSPDGKRLLLATHDELFETGIDGGPMVLRWKATVEELGIVDYAPDGDGFVAEMQIPDGDLWLAEGSFR